MASVFTRIIQGELPAERIYETERELAFLDINPISQGHTLVVPKREVADFHELPLPELHSLLGATQNVTRAVIQAMGTSHYNLALNNGPLAGQVVFHVHFHIIPRYEGGPASRVRGKYGEGQMETVGAAIRAALAALPETPV